MSYITNYQQLTDIDFGNGLAGSGNIDFNVVNNGNFPTSPNRMDKSKQLVGQVINNLGGDRIGIVAYARNVAIKYQASVIVPSISIK